MKKIFVGNLAWEATEESLRPLFEAFGPVESLKVIVDQYTGKSRGYAFVEMGSADDAQKAIDGLNDKPHLGRNLRVNPAQDRPQTSRPGGNGMGRPRSPAGGPGGFRGGNSSGGGGGGSRGDGERRPFRSRERE